MAVKYQELLEELQQLYWQSAQRELCNMLLFYPHLRNHAEGRPEEPNPAFGKFEKMFKTWDVDVLYEPVDQSFVSKVGKPFSVEHIKHVGLAPIVCSGCNNFVRSLVFYECNQGCTQPNRFISWLQKDIRSLGVPESENFLDSVPVRFCQSCITGNHFVAGCGVAHLKKIYHRNPSLKPKGGRTELVTVYSRSDSIVVLQKFQLRCENEMTSTASRGVATSPLKKGARIVKNVARNTMMVEASPLNRLVRGICGDLRAKVAPAGFFHLSMQFGPLIFETGLDGYELVDQIKFASLTNDVSINRGVLVHPRPYPRLFCEEDTPTNFIEYTDDKMSQYYTRQCLVLFDDSKNKKIRTLATPTREIRQRNCLAQLKRVCGGAFTGYLHPNSTQETRILEQFVLEANKRKARTSKTVKARRKQLYASADRLLELLKDCISGEVDKYLDNIASLLLHSKTRLSFNKFNNNCQGLTDRFLTGKHFEYVFPRLPVDVSETELEPNIST
ncbi:uncharacterized protein M421DRAFT_390770 [Didymella exigua CBS 183.55]|uniref:CRIB domain-containing protein n=1 Tax=Didymella exigua CBS 183.55 TaxID=1150837 RepID=A0A6A5RNK5_9PLEO|nr:uncharacterized protein M421DRAFT_390770 [Didymella exigua CBS 183.55]KAF1928890.1 hypothetical protein M421DRAFT_390770 [Didymella exigua CBS 183.55]